MQFGIAIDLGPETSPLGERLRAIEPLLRRAERHGFDSIWVGENYAQGPGEVTSFHGPSALMVLAALSQETDLGLGTGVILLRAYNVLRLAYDIALVDSMSDGRLSVGIGLGRPPLALRFGQEHWSAEAIDERIEALLMLLQGGDRFIGKHISIQGGISPVGHQGRVPPLWIGGGVSASVARAARYGCGWYASSPHSFGLVKELSGRYRQELKRHSPELVGRVAVNRLTVLKTDRDQGIAAGHHYAGRIVEAYGRVGALDDNGVPLEAGYTNLRRALPPRSIMGDASDCIRRLHEYAEIGVTDIQFRIAPLGMPLLEVLETLDVLGESVLPRFAAERPGEDGGI